MMNKKVVYFRQIESLYQHLIKGVIVYENNDSNGQYSIIEYEIDEKIYHMKIYNSLIIEDGEEEYKRVQKIYTQEEVVKNAQKKLEKMRKEK